MFEDIDNKDKASGPQAPEEVIRPGNIPPRENLSLYRSGPGGLKTADPPALPNAANSEEFEKRMRDLHEKGRRRGFKFSVIGLAGGIAITLGAIYLLDSFKGDVATMSREIDRRGQEPVEAVIDPDNICHSDYCCLASLRLIRNNGYARTEPGRECPPGQTLGSLQCLNSLYWCAPAAESSIIQ